MKEFAHWLSTSHTIIALMVDLLISGCSMIIGLMVGFFIAEKSQDAWYKWRMSR